MTKDEKRLLVAALLLSATISHSGFEGVGKISTALFFADKLIKRIEDEKEAEDK